MSEEHFHPEPNVPEESAEPEGSEEAEVEARPILRTRSRGPFEPLEGVDETETDAPAEAPRKESRRAGIDLSRSAAVSEEEVLGRIDLKAVIEALLFAADDPVTPAQIAKAIGGVKSGTVKAAIDELKAAYDERRAGFRIAEEAGGYVFLTDEEQAPFIKRLRSTSEIKKISASALETLAVVAYKQPVQRAEIEDIRGVGCGPMLNALMEQSLVKIVGRAEVLGKPLLYGTTKKFLEVFGLNSLKDLPKSDEIAS